MVVDNKTTAPPTSASAGKRVLVGTNVAVATALVVGIVVVLQLIAYNTPARYDMTSSGVNSLSEGTENLLSGLDQNVRLTSLYFETDREEEDQQRYRRGAQDLLELYEATNRSKVQAEWVNPLKDHEKYQKLVARLREKPTFAEGIAAHQARIDAYKNDLDGQMRALLQSELSSAAEAAVGAIGGTQQATPVDQVEMTLRRLDAQLQATREAVDSLTTPANPQLAAAVDELRSLYREMADWLKRISDFGTDIATRSPDLPQAGAKFLRETANRCADVVAAIEAETTALQELEPLEIDDLLRQLSPTSNAIVVDTDADAMVVDYSSVWPALDQRGGARVPFEGRAFKGEEKLTAAILRATHKEQTAVVFVRYGGQPLFFGGFMPGQPPAPYRDMKAQLEDANFVVEEWDLKSSETPPDIDPVPTRTIFVVLKPEPPRRGPMGQPSQEPPFGESHRRALLSLLGDNARALFIAGWAPGPFGPIPSTYEYADYLKDTWGITVDTSALLIETVNFAPGKYQVVARGREFLNMDGLEIAKHPIVSGPQAAQITFPVCAPLELADPPPEGVEIERLVTLPKRDGIWGVRNLQAYQAQLDNRDYLTKEEDDLEGPFDLAAATTKGDAKIVVISSNGFATDAVAFARSLGLTAHGFAVRSVNPGNVTLLINSLHWLNDNTQFMDIGKVIDAAVLEIPKSSTVRTVQALTIFIWPVLALACGGVAWWVRRT